MKKLMFNLLAVLFVFSFFQSIQAQQTFKIKMYLDKDNYIKTDHDTLKVNPGDAIQFYTGDKNTYRVLIYNKNGFFNIDSEILQFTVDKNHSRTYTVGTPPADFNWAEMFPIQILNSIDPEPIPEAPPRIVISEEAYNNPE